ncbi:MAG: methyltransferase domain-containing protein [Saprospiraceae bacterium]
MSHSEQEEYWNERYIAGETGWDLGMASPPIAEYADQLGDKSIDILIPGCGSAYEAKYLLELGFSSITLIDISEFACQRLRSELLPEFDGKVKVIQGDFFEFNGQFDLIIEQTFFCALPVDLRQAYMEKMYVLLKPRGKLVGLLFDRQFELSPPFGGSKEEYRKLFEQKFKICTLEACTNSVKPRENSELFCILKKQ